MTECLASLASPMKIDKSHAEASRATGGAITLVILELEAFPSTVGMFDVIPISEPRPVIAIDIAQQLELTDRPLLD